MADMNFPPPGACDAHVHVIGPKRRFPLAAGSAWTPRDALTGELVAMLRRLGLARVVLVQPSFYRTDNSCMLDAMAQIPGARGVAVVAENTSDDELDALDDAGIRGLRVNIASGGAVPLAAAQEAFEAAARLCERHGWHVQAFVPAAMIAPLAPTLHALPVATVFDHFGLMSPDGGDADAQRALVGLLEADKVWVKISGAYRIADNPYDPRIGALARTLCQANPERIVWGSDWPHTPNPDPNGAPVEGELPFQDIDTRALLDLVPRWLEDDGQVARVLVSNPQRLYGFD